MLNPKHRWTSALPQYLATLTWGYKIAFLGIITGLLGLYIFPIISIDPFKIFNESIGLPLFGAGQLNVDLTFSELLAALTASYAFLRNAIRLFQEIGQDPGISWFAFKIKLWGLRLFFWGILGGYTFMLYRTYKRYVARIAQNSADLVQDVIVPAIIGSLQILGALVLWIQLADYIGSGILFLVGSGFLLVTGGGLHFAILSQNYWGPAYARRPGHPPAQAHFPPQQRVPHSAGPWPPRSKPTKYVSTPDAAAYKHETSPFRQKSFSPYVTEPLEQPAPTASIEENDKTMLFSEHPQPQAVLVSEDGRTFPLTFPETTIGRHSTNHLTLPHPSISKRHARIFYHKEKFWLQDLNSTNGTEINGRRFRGQTVPLEPGALVRFGMYTSFRFDIKQG